MAEPFDLLGSIRNAGAIFLGQWTPESVGDYAAGPNHVLPTGGTARFSSPLSVDDFVKKSSVLSYSFEALEMDADTVLAIADKEGLWAHGRAVSLRLEAVADFVDELDAEIAGTKRDIPAEALLDFDVLDDVTGDELEDEDGGS
jgi:histidinol dehydrogenase